MQILRRTQPLGNRTGSQTQEQKGRAGLAIGGKAFPEILGIVL